ncbi:MAG: peptide deformylase [Gammaproteobacteria bacterium]|nr:peptide deformylase [Gammaproteobacteria bacterium]NIR81790.1 peptide deformylase [Gammaproteobacteria bacterium]NIR88622.1 peptide deformylase [Gammaproteobacteria bacterium]NIU02898.1 peptide deformylase [Gammaproteobacteria bacterium]NIV50419.1 peptide deformylase [Gammaproteobacteria bacterium]
MAILDILHYPDPRLRNRAAPVERVDDDIRRLVDDMFETMYDAPGVGLAATQVDVPRRVVVIDVSEQRDSPLCLINPEVLGQEGAVEMEEGCLSVPGIFDMVQRAERVKMRALDREGNPYELAAEGLLAVCVQHEIDHLNGKLFIDHLSQLKRQRIKKKADRLQRQAL